MTAEWISCAAVVWRIHRQRQRCYCKRDHCHQCVQSGALWSWLHHCRCWRRLHWYPADRVAFVTYDAGTICCCCCHLRSDVAVRWDWAVSVCRAALCCELCNHMPHWSVILMSWQHALPLHARTVPDVVSHSARPCDTATCCERIVIPGRPFCCSGTVLLVSLRFHYILAHRARYKASRRKSRRCRILPSNSLMYAVN